MKQIYVITTRILCFVSTYQSTHLQWFSLESTKTIYKHFTGTLWYPGILDTYSPILCPYGPLVSVPLNISNQYISITDEQYLSLVLNQETWHVTYILIHPLFISFSCTRPDITTCLIRTNRCVKIAASYWTWTKL